MSTRRERQQDDHEFVDFQTLQLRCTNRLRTSLLNYIQNCIHL